MLFKFISAASSMHNEPIRMHTFAVAKSENKKRRNCIGCYQLLRRSMNSKAASKKVKKVYSYCEECEGNPPYCLSCFNNAHVKASFVMMANG